MTRLRLHALEPASLGVTPYHPLVIGRLASAPRGLDPDHLRYDRLVTDYCEGNFVIYRRSDPSLMMVSPAHKTLSGVAIADTVLGDRLGERTSARI